MNAKELCEQFVSLDKAISELDTKRHEIKSKKDALELEIRRTFLTPHRFNIAIKLSSGLHLIEIVDGDLFLSPITTI